MPKIIYVEAGGARHEVEVPVGNTVMEAARALALPGIVAECGGACACATCHVFVDGEWAARLPEPTEAEKDMVEFAEGFDPGRSRLSCQLVVQEAFDGLVVQIASA